MIFQQASRDASVALQYRVGTSGNFIDVGNTTTFSTTGLVDGTLSSLYTEVLPAAANNQSVVQVRWIYWESAGSAGSRDRAGIDEINITGTAAGCSTVNAGLISSSTGTNICGASTTPTLTLGGGVSTGTGITYVWESSTDGINYTPISGATTTTYAPGTLTTTTYFRAITTCTTSGAQGTANITININPVPTATISGTTTICNGANTDITFTGTPNAVVTYNINGGANQTVTLDGSGNAIVNTGALIANATYDLVTVVGGSCSQAISGNAVVTISNFTASISGATTICSGGNTDITFTGSLNATVTYAVNGGANQTILLDGSGNATVNTGALTADATYTLVDITSGPCTQTITGSVIVTINNPTATISGTATICSGGNADITFTGTPNATVTYTVNGGANQTVVLDGAGNAVLNSGAITATTTYALVDVISGTCTSILTGNAVISVGSPTATISGTATICEGNSAVITFAGTPSGIVTYTVNGGANQTVTLDGSGDATVHTGNLSANATYTLVSIDAGTCSAVLAGSAIITVNPLPTAAISGTATICSGNGTNITFNGTANAVVTYNINGGANTTVTLDGTGNATVATGNLSATTTYDLVSVSLNTCSQSQTGSVVVTVNTTPTATISGTATICSGGNSNITFTGTPNAVITYNINGGTNTTVTLNGAGTATVNTGAITANATYNLVSAVLNTCSATLTGSTTVTVNPMPTATISGTTTICSGNGATITFNGTANAVVTYNINGGTNTTVTLNGAGTATVATGNLSATTTYNLVSVSLNSCSQAQTGSAVMTVNTTPTATISGTATICSGGNSNITFTGTANAIVTYNVNGGTNTTITLNGAGTATLPSGTLTATTTYNLVSVILGTCSATLTGSATVTVNPLPTATISGTTTICSGTGTNITFAGTPNAVVTYNINGGANTTVTLSGAGTATVATGNLTANATYDLVSATLNSCPQTLSGSAVVTVNPIPTASIAGTTTICSGNSATITFVGTPNAVITYNINGGTNTTVTLSGAGIATVSTGTITASATYNLVSVSLNSCSQTLTGSAVVTVNPLPTATISGTTTICSGTGTTITFNGTANAVVTYNINGGTNTTIILNGAGTATLTTGNLTANTTYNLVSASLNSCSQSQSGSAVVTVDALPTATISGTNTICSGTTTNITFNGTPNAVVTYNINGGANISATLNGTGTATVATTVLTANTTYNMVSVSLNTCSQTQSGSAVITVTPLPAATISGTTTICSGGTVAISFSGTPNAIVTYNIDGGANQAITLDGAGSGTVVTGVLTANTIYNLVSITGNGCGQALTGDETITVTQLPVATISGTTAICAGNNTDIIFTGTPNAIVSYNEDGGVTQTITLDGAGSATLNTGALITTKVFNLVSVNLNACGQNMTGNATVTVNPLPTAAISGTTTICSGTDADITFTGTPNAIVSYDVNGGANATVILDAAGNAVVNTGTLTAQAVYSLVSVNSGLCISNVTGTATVSVNINPTASISGTATVCSGSSTNVTFTGTPNATVTYAINSGAQLTIALDGAGLATLSTGNITANATYSLQSVSLNSCVAGLTGNASVTVLPAPTATISGTVTLTAGNIHNIIFAGTPNAVVSYNINGGATQTVTLDGTGNATVATGVLYNTLVYDLIDVTLGCTTPASGSATVTVSTSYSTLYTYTTDVSGDFNFVAPNAVATDLTLYNGATLSGSACPTGFTSENYSSATSFDPATNKGVTAKVSPDGYRRLVVTGFTVGVRRSADGPEHVRLAYSVNNGANWISSGVDELPDNGACGSVNTLTWNVTPFQVQPGTDGIIFGVFGFDAAATTGQLQIVDMGVNGAVIDIPLPITLTYFKGNCFKGDITCQWGVAHESNIADYEVEYSADGKTFNKVATVAPYQAQQAGEKVYSTIIYNGAEGLYRLASVENSGVKEYSKTVRVKCDDATVAIPTVVNVIDGTLNMWPGSEFLLGTSIDVKLFNMNGSQIANYTISSNGAKQQTQVSLPTGVYMVRLVQGGTVSAHKVVIE